MSGFDSVAESFDHHRTLPVGVPEMIRAAILDAIGASPLRPRLLDLGAGSGRTGWPFVTAGDDYVGVDVSPGMLREFARGAIPRHSVAPRLVRADGRQLPFRDATFDAVMLIQMFGGLHGWRRLIAEARRVLRWSGSLIIGRTVAPAEGLDARMKQHLASVLAGLGFSPEQANPRDDIEHALNVGASDRRCVIAGAWSADRTPRGFIERHGTGARFAALPAPIKEGSLSVLGTWAAAAFGSLDAIVSERHAFELKIFKFQKEIDR
jgi:ubiquinone/menaquinone biosynthesis C-methylase UbiE